VLTCCPVFVAVIPYVDPPKEKTEADMGGDYHTTHSCCDWIMWALLNDEIGAMSTTLPMAAVSRVRYPDIRSLTDLVAYRCSPGIGKMAKLF